MDDLISKLKSKIPDNHYNFDYINIAYLAIIKNSTDKDIPTSRSEGSFVSENNKQITFNQLDLGKKNPETNLYYLKKGSGSILLQEVINDLKIKGIKTIILQAAKPDLVPYYEKHNFIVIQEQIPLFVFDDSVVYYGDQSSGPLMYRNL